MTTETVDNIVADIMCNDGPDGHCDGHEIITEFIIALSKGEGQQWAENYFKDKTKFFYNP